MSAEQSQQPTQTPRPSKSKGLVKNILLIVLAFTSLLFFAFGFIQKIEADKQREIAVKAQIEAENNFKEAEMQRAVAIYQQKRAVTAQAEAEKNRLLAEQMLADCKSKRK